MIELKIGELLIEDDNLHDIEEFSRYVMEHGKISRYSKEKDGLVFSPIEKISYTVYKEKETQTEGSL